MLSPLLLQGMDNGTKTPLSGSMPLTLSDL
jgi:hypothetical protein